MGWLKDMLLNWLELNPAPMQTINIQESMSFPSEVIRNQIWYRGDASELSQLYHRLLDQRFVEKSRFWSSAPAGDPNVRKIHSGLPAIMVDVLAQMVKSDMGEPTFTGDDEAREKWKEVSSELNFPDLVKSAVRDCLVSCDGAFKISINTSISPYPLVEFVPGDRVEFITSHGRIIGVDFWSDQYKGHQKYRLRERYTKCKDPETGKWNARIEYALFKGNGQVPLDTLEELKDLGPATICGDYLLAVPLKFFDSLRFPGRGKSIYDCKTDDFDALDEVISQWMDAVRAGRVTKYIPRDMIPSSPDNGELMRVNSFGTNFVKVETLDGADKGQIEVVQPDIQYEAYLTTYMTALDLCLQGVMSPATLGIDVGKMSSAQAQREKKDVTGYTRNAITDTLSRALPTLISAILMTYDNMQRRSPGKYQPEVTFGEYGAPDFESRIQSVGQAAAAGIMSVEAQVDELWGNSKDNKWKAQEVSRIKAAKGIEEGEPPQVGGELIDVAANSESLLNAGTTADSLIAQEHEAP